MASTNTLLVTIVTLLLLKNTTISARDLPLDSTNIAARLNSGGLMECWNALYELKSCTNEIIMFFLNGQTSLGVTCCEAVHVITTNCWPAMLTSLGFTTDETNVLRGYCQNPSPGGGSSTPSGGSTPSGDSSPAASPVASPARA